jgi:outer membrane protein OmpA-like peptidoglycan-associated protein
MKTLSVKHNLFFLVLILFSSACYPQNKGNSLFDVSTLKIAEISTNSIHSDFGPSVINDTLYFTTFNDKLLDKTDKRLRSKEYYDLYKAGIDKQGNVKSGRIALKEFVTQYNEGPVSWCEKTGELFITQNYADQPTKLKPFQKKINRLKIVIAKQINGKWKQVGDFAYNNPLYSVGHPALTQSGDTLIFASDMPGGYGETDLYMSIRKDGNWSVPVNLGPRINTSGKDEFPFITGNSYPDRFLIFASSGHNSMGGFDLYYKKLNDPSDEIHQFAAPINSVNDDFAMTLPENVEFGYFTSNRPGKGNDDIYKLTFDKFITYLQDIYVLDAQTLKPIPRAQVDFCKKKSGETDLDGKISFLFEKKSVCTVTASALGYKDKSKLIQIGKPLPGSILKDTIFLEMNVNEKIVLKNIYYDFDKWNILPESATQLDRLVSLMKENSQMNVDLSAHTDSRGTVNYNLKLSHLRAQAAVDYLIAKGISKIRITGTGYGKSQLINTCNEDCTPVQHRENRRTEIYIPGFIKGESVQQKFGDYSDGKSDHTPGSKTNK